jgi:hypothetical protein
LKAPEKTFKIDKERFLKSLIWNNHYPIFQPTRSTYEDLINSGSIKLLKNNDLKVALSAYYLENDWWSQFLVKELKTPIGIH